MGIVPVVVLLVLLLSGCGVTRTSYEFEPYEYRRPEPQLRIVKPVVPRREVWK